MRVKLKNGSESKTSGFTLIEALVAMALGAIMFAAIYTGLAWGFANVHSNRTTLRATQILVKRAESIRLCPFDQITDTTYNPATFTDYFDPKNQAAGGGGTVYNGSFTASVPPVGSVPEAYRTSMLLVTIGVSWTSGTTPHSRSLQTYVARKGLQEYVSTGQ
jgi:prepilin-type N-terminal cleavage/methylation domain-containing protein